MIWVQRIGEFARSVVVLVIDLFTIISELHARVWELGAKVARDIDSFADELKDKI